MPQGNFRFGEWTAYPDELVIKAGNTTERLEPKTMAVLELLATRSPQVVSIEDMINSAWSGSVVGDNAVYRAITVLRRALGDTARSPTYIESISRKGYRLKGEVEFLTPSSQANSTSGELRTLGHLVITIDLDEETRLATRVGTAIARFLSWAADAFKVQLWPEETSDSDYQLNLHVSTAGEGAELSWELVECRYRTLVFSNNDRLLLPEAPETMLRIAETVADGVADQIRRHKTQCIVHDGLDTDQMNYWELILTSDHFENMNEAKLAQRESRLQAACNLFPALAPAHAAYADLQSWRVLANMTDDARSTAASARASATRAIEFDRDSPYVLSRCGTVFARLGHHERGVELCRRAHELAPSASSREALARVLCFAGRPEEAIPLLQQIHDTMPRGHVFHYGKLVVALTQAGRLKQALDYSYRSVSNFPGDYYAWAVHCNLLFAFDDVPSGLEAWEEVRRLAPALTLENIIAGTNKTYARTDEQRDFLTGGLRRLESLLGRDAAD